MNLLNLNSQLNSQMSGNKFPSTEGWLGIPKTGWSLNWERGHLARINSPLWRGGIEDDGVVLNSPLNPERMLKRGGCEADGVLLRAFRVISLGWHSFSDATWID